MDQNLHFQQLTLHFNKTKEYHKSIQLSLLLQNMNCFSDGKNGIFAVSAGNK
jgi:hypothetical protein